MIKILIVDDAEDVRTSIKKLLQFEKEVEVVGEANNGLSAIDLTEKLKPDIVLMDINMPQVNGIQATQEITLKFPQVGVIILSVQGEVEYLRKAMSAGAREYLVKPFSSDELINAIKQVKEFLDKQKSLVSSPLTEPMLSLPTSKVITVFGTKGGVGKSLIATNLAVSLAEFTGEKVVIVDLDLQFGDISIMLNVVPQRSIADVMKVIDNLDSELLMNFLTDYKEKIKVLAAPPKPEDAEIVNTEGVEKILKLLRQVFNYVIIDTVSNFLETTLVALDSADIILLITTLDLPTIKNTKLAFDTMMSLKYPKEKIRLVLNRSDSQTGLKVSHLESSLQCKIDAFIPSDGKLVIPSVNKGEPFVLLEPEANISQSLRELVKLISGGEEKPAEDKEKVTGIGKILKPIFSRRI